ncbi:hypothetical protein PG985_011320 [Apiospora marii]|uniref:BTB domain-containing protein n=1 Tax=Apiospora marii TaxID=335849 RepID=A0ABR1STB6_9PEZI
MASASAAAMLLDSGQKLYKSELFADAELVVGDEKWPIHKAIVCSRSDWFMKALAGPFKEATANKVDITGHDPKYVGLVLRYLYTGEVPELDVLPSLRELIDFFVTADYLAIKGLATEAAAKIAFHLDHLHCHIEPEEPILTDNALEEFFEVARLAYTSNPSFEVLRCPVERFISRRNSILLRDTRFLDELRNIPELFETTIRGMLPPETRDAIPKGCASCHKTLVNLSDYAETWAARVPDPRNQLHARTSSRKPNMSADERDDPDTMISKSNEALFRKEEYSDATLVVNGEKWPVHKSILCTRSKYFKKAFSGSFKEANTSEIILDGHSAAAMNFVLYYLYTGNVVDDQPSSSAVDQPDVFPSFPSLDSAVDLFVTVDYFGVEHIKNDAVLIVQERLRDIYYYGLPTPNAPEELLLSPSDRDSFFRAVRLAYASAPTLEGMRNPIEGFLQDTDFLLTQDTRFMREAKDIPEFALAIINMAYQATEEQLKGCRKSSGYCFYCKKLVWSFAETWVACVQPINYTHDVVDLKLRGACSGCVKNRE